MASYRDTVMDALLALLSARLTTTFSTYSRRFKTWQEMIQDVQAGASPTPQPALFLFDGVGLGGGFDKVEKRSQASPAVATMVRTIVVYARYPGAGTPGGQTDGDMAGGEVLYPLLESIQTALAPDDAQRNVLTLGGLVQHCWIEGEVNFISGEIDPGGQMMMTIPVSILLTPNAS